MNNQSDTNEEDSIDLDNTNNAKILNESKKEEENEEDLDLKIARYSKAKNITRNLMKKME